MTNLGIKFLKSEKTESGSTHGQFLMSALRPGQGVTIGNVLRRVLLSEIEGISITAVRFAGISHEFSTIEGIREDILEILLNLKGVVIEGDITGPQFGQLKIQEPTIITADLIQLPANLRIVNPNHYIATLSHSNIIEIEFKIEGGIGYRLANKTFDDKLDDFLQIDAIFMPLQKVDFKIENIYDNSSSITERLFLNIWTNGSISPEDAILSASKFIIELFNSIMENKFTQQIDKDATATSNLIPINPHINIAIEELQLSVRAYNCLKRAEINTIGDLLKYSPEKLQELKNFGRKSADEVFTTLKNKLGIVLK
jgi:DNA-directed RNA polymerase subunit alpha